jgi:acyl-CoA thioesterase FadM
VSDADEEFTERLLCRAPVIVRRRVQWGDCDPAKVVYTPRFAEFAASGFFWFKRTVLGEVQADLDAARVGTPMKALALEFYKTLRVDEYFDMTLYVTAVRNRTFDLLLDARDREGVPRFRATLSPILVDRATFTSIAIPDPLRGVLERYRERHAAPSLATRDDAQ